MNWNAFTKNLLHSLKVETEVGYSYKDESLKGFTCLSLFRTNALTVRVYHILDEIQPLNKHFATVFDPSKRAENAQLVLLRGDLDIVEFKYHPRTIQPTEAKSSNVAFSTHNLFTYKDSQGIVPGFHYESVGHLTDISTKNLNSYGSTTYISTNDIYGIKINEESTFLEIQYEPTSDIKIYTQSDEVYERDKSRINLNRSEFINLVNKIDYLITL